MVSDFLKFLTDEDRQVLLGNATMKNFEPEDVIVTQGETQEAIYVLESGEARVEKQHGDLSVEISRFEAGDVFGEMGFVEGFDASASVIADEPCKVHVISNDLVQKLIDGDPGFYGRFYHSLAHTLSQRLRDTTVDSIAEFSWGSRVIEREPETEPEEVPGWGGGSPFDDAAKS
ncbi:MAG: cyclic nucleotide-binding domain-containing protein [Gammaproteobacteria bacterium]|nr:cyclic nucleotide-binding domain-containing protein [Gammaproteobacteria bacterium]